MQPPAIRQIKSLATVSEDGKVYVNTSCSTDLYNAAVLYARENGLDSAQDVFRVAATKFLKSAGYLSK